MNDYTLPAMEKLQRALAKDLVEVFEKDGLVAAYAKLQGVAPKIYPAREPLRAADLDKVADLLADCFLILGKKR